MKRILVMLATVLLISMQAYALDDAHWRKADAAIDRGIEYLRTTQNEDGSWSPKPGPAITALVMQVMLDRPDIAPDDPTVAKALAYILQHVREDGGIHGGILENYNTAICLSALARVNDHPDAAQAIAAAQEYLKSLQWKAGMTTPDGEVITEDHPFVGGAGYGGHGRPDGSNTQIMLQGLYDSGVDCNDPAFQRAIVFISRMQGIESNEMNGDAIAQDGGMIYSTTISKDLVGIPESKANPELMDKAEELAKQGVPLEEIEEVVVGLRTYGSMTYAGFKSYVYAQLDRDDPRVVAAYDWIRSHWMLDRNPGMPEGMDQQGLYYMYMTLGRALGAWGSTTIETPQGRSHDWANELIDALTSRQREDGSWVNEADRWMEGDPNLVTAYALIALEEAIR